MNTDLGEGMAGIGEEEFLTGLQDGRDVSRPGRLDPAPSDTNDFSYAEQRFYMNNSKLVIGRQ